MDSWRSHQWLVPGGERITVSGMRRRRYQCALCGRAFVTDEPEHRKWAINQYQKVYFGEIGEHDAALEQSVSNRWLSEFCPKTRLPADDDDRKKIPNVEP